VPEDFVNHSHRKETQK